MKILKVEIENYKAIRVFEQELNGENMAVAGTTGEGKTTAISALWDIIEKVGDPLTHGAKKGHIKLTLGDGDKTVTAERKFTAKTNSVIIMTGEGQKINVSDFKQWYNKLGVDPHQLMALGPAQRTNVLLQAVDLPEGVDLEKLDKDREAAATDRSLAKAKRDRDEAEIGEEPEQAAGVDTAELMQDLNEIQAHNHEVERQRDRVGVCGEQKIEYAEKIEALKDQIRMYEEDIGRAEAEEAELLEWLDKNEPKPTDEIEQALASAGEINEKASRHQAWEARQQRFLESAEEWEKLDKKVKALDKAKKDAVAAAKWPIDGLAVQNGEIVYNGVLLSNLGKSEQVLVCGAIAASTFKDGQLRVVRLDGTESMSKDDFLTLEALFNEKGIQVLSSRVTRGDLEDYEIVISEGGAVTQSDW